MIYLLEFEAKTRVSFEYISCSVLQFSYRKKIAKRTYDLQYKAELEIIAYSQLFCLVSIVFVLSHPILILYLPLTIIF